MTVRFDQVPVVFMPVPRPPARIRRARRFRLRVWIGIIVGLVAFWYGLAAWVFSL